MKPSQNPSTPSETPHPSRPLIVVRAQFASSARVKHDNQRVGWLCDLIGWIQRGDPWPVIRADRALGLIMTVHPLIPRVMHARDPPLIHLNVIHRQDEIPTNPMPVPVPFPRVNLLPTQHKSSMQILLDTKVIFNVKISILCGVDTTNKITK